MLKTNVKKCLSVLLSVLMLLPVLGSLPVTSASAYSVGDTVQYGSYPQSRVTDGTLISALNAAEKTWASYNYYSGTGNNYDGQMQPGNWMRFADFFYNGNKYRAVTFDEYRPGRPGSSRNSGESQQDENGYYTGNVYYFKYEPLIWKVLDPSTGYMVCQSIVDAQMYQNIIYQNGGNYYQGIGSSNYANNYATGTVREWLNNDFYNTAFTADQKANIKTTALNNNGYNGVYNAPATNDKIFLLSYADVTNSAYQFNSNGDRLGTATEYTRAQGLWVSGGHSLWWLRTPSSKSKNGSYVDISGIPTGDNENDDTLKGIRPGCCLTELKNDAAISESLYSGGHEHSFSAAWAWANDYSSAALTLTCAGCGEVFSGTDNAPQTVEVTPAGCSTDRVIKYKASVTLNDELYTTLTDNITLTGTAGHNYGAPVWTWVIRPTLEVVTFDIGSTANIDIFPTYYQIQGQEPVAKNSASTLYVFTGRSTGRANWIDINPGNLSTPDVYNLRFEDYSVRGSEWCGGFYIGGTNCTVNITLSGSVTEYCYGYSGIGGNVDHPDEYHNMVNIFADGTTNARYEAGWNWGSGTKKVVYFTNELVQGSDYTIHVDNNLQNGFTDAIYNGYVMTIAADDNASVPVATATMALICPDCGKTVVLSDVAPQPAAGSDSDPAKARFFGTVTYDGETYTSYSSDIPAAYAQEHTVTYYANGGEGDPVENAYPYGKKVSLAANTFTPPEGKLFDGWKNGDTVYQTGDKFTVTGAAEFYAQWSDSVYGILDPGEAEGETETRFTVLPGTVITLPSNPYTAPGDTIFSGWSDGENIYQPGYNYTLNETTVFTAQWTDAVYAYLAPGEAEGEILTHSRVLPGTQITLPANPYTAPEGMLFNGWSDGENVYNAYYRYTLNETTTFTAQWVTGVNVTFDSNGGSAVASQLIYPNTAASQPAVPTKAGCTFRGWRLDGEYFDFSTRLTEDITLCAVWVDGIEINESFENNSTPAGWTAETNWQFLNTRHNGSGSVQPHSGAYMAYHPYYSSSRLTMPAVDLSGQSAVSLSFWYQNCYDGSLADNLIVSYRVNGGEWRELFRTIQEHRAWTQAEISLPPEALTANVEIGFYADVNGGWGVFLDDVSLAGDSGHNLAFSAEENVLTATCSNDICAWETHTLTLTLNAPAKTVYGDENSESATLTDLGRFDLELGLSVSEDDIEYYQGETLLPAAPVNAGDYIARLTVTVDGTDYTIEKAYSIAKATPAPELPSGLAAIYGDLLSSVLLPEGWAWDDPADTSVGNAGDNAFNATFTPADTDNYDPLTVALTVNVDKATPEYEIPEGLTALYGTMLADVELPAGWAWNEAPETLVGGLGDHTYAAVFTPEDTDNYNTVSETIGLNVYTNYIFVPAKEPNCTRPGNTAYYNNSNRSYYVTDENNELVEIELYTTVIPATGHIYGTEGDARFTCTVCGHVDQERKADAEYEDMLPYYLAEFNKVKQEVKSACDSRALSGDSEASAALIEKAKNDIDNLAWERSKSLDENKAAVYGILSRLNNELAAQRAYESSDVCPYCGSRHNGSILGIIHAFFYKFEQFFRTLFAM